VSSPEHHARVEALVDDLLRLIVAHTDSLPPLQAKVIAAAATARLHVAQTMLVTETVDPPKLLSHMARFPWHSVIAPALIVVERHIERAEQAQRRRSELD
jgi:hypothetical protein